MNILFDLDGTLTDSSEGITKSISYALREMGQPEPPKSELLPCIGPPLFESFNLRLGLTNEEDAEKAVQLYRARYTTTGYLENKLYEGIVEVLQHLHNSGDKLFVATAKPHPQVAPILTHFDISKYFVNHYGVDPNKHSSGKTKLIAGIIETEGLNPMETVMIGDRKYDITGALDNKLTTIGASYGYGNREELEEAGSHYYAESPATLIPLIEGLR